MPNYNAAANLRIREEGFSRERGGGGTRVLRTDPPSPPTMAPHSSASSPSPAFSTPPFRSNYDYQWGRDSDVQELTVALAARMRASADLTLKEGIDSEAISLTLLTMYRVHSSDLELQALLAVAASCRWLWLEGSDQINDVLQMLDEVAESIIECSQTSPANDPIINAPALNKQFTENGLRASVEGALGASVTEVLLTPSYFQVSFVNGDYGEGAFDGALCMQELTLKPAQADKASTAENGLYLLDLSRKDRHNFKGANLPATDEEVEEALVGDFWKCKVGCREDKLLLPSQRIAMAAQKLGEDFAAERGESNSSSNGSESDYDEEPVNDIVSHTKRTGNILKRGAPAQIEPPRQPPPQPSFKQRNDEFRDYLLRKCLQKDK